MADMLIPIHSTCRRQVPATARILLLALLPIGDTLFTTPTIRALRARYPRAALTALVYRRTAALMHCIPYVDDVIVLPLGPDWAGPTPLLRVVHALRARHFDVAIDFTSPAYKMISLLAGIPTRTYLKVDPLFWLLPGPHQHWRTTHAAEHYYDAARELDLPPWSTVDHTLALELPAHARAEAAHIVRSHAARAGQRPLIGLHAGGRWLEGRKQWPAAHFATLARRLRQQWDAQIVLLGGPEEAELAHTIARAAGGDPIVAAGAMPLLTSLALVGACDLFVGNDSALLHGAAALGTSYVGLFGPTCPANYAPLPCRQGQGIVALPPEPCRMPQYFVGGSALWHRPCCRDTCAALQHLEVETVLAHAGALLSRRQPGCAAPAPSATTRREGRSAPAPRCGVAGLSAAPTGESRVAM